MDRQRERGERERERERETDIDTETKRDSEKWKKNFFPRERNERSREASIETNKKNPQYQFNVSCQTNHPPSRYLDTPTLVTLET